MLIMLSNFHKWSFDVRRAWPEPAARLDRPRRATRAAESLDRVRRRRADRELRPIARARRPCGDDIAQPRHWAERPRRAARQQLDRASRLLSRHDGLRCDHLHRARRDEPQPARRYFRAAEAEARAASGWT